MSLRGNLSNPSGFCANFRRILTPSLASSLSSFTHLFQADEVAALRSSFCRRRDGKCERPLQWDFRSISPPPPLPSQLHRRRKDNGRKSGRHPLPAILTRSKEDDGNGVVVRAGRQGEGELELEEVHSLSAAEPQPLRPRPTDSQADGDAAM